MNAENDNHRLQEIENIIESIDKERADLETEQAMNPGADKNVLQEQIEELGNQIRLLELERKQILRGEKPGTVADNVLSFQGGETLGNGKYRLGTYKLGHGGFGLTFVAEDLRLKRQVVVKVPNRDLVKEKDYDRFLRRFKREGEALARLDHPHVVKVIEFFQEQERVPCLVMEYVEGVTLQAWVEQQGALPITEAVEQFRRLASALDTAHTLGLLHCDVKPDNIMRRQRDGALILIDFGSTKLLNPHSETVTTAVSKGYVPYEVSVDDYQPNAKLDLYSLAATLYFAVTGQKPKSAMDRKLTGSRLLEPQQSRPEIPDWLNAAIVQGMALEPKDRPTSIADWSALLGLTLGKLPSNPELTPELKTVNWEKWGVISGMMLGVLGLIVAIGTPLFEKLIPEPEPDSPNSAEQRQPQN